MNATAREKLEETIRNHHDAGEYHEAATAAVRGYGPEILGFLVSMHRDEDVGAETFSRFTEDMWKGIPKFQWRSSFRTWAYTIARNAAFRYMREPRQKRGRRLNTHEISKIALEVRSSTMPHLRTEVKDGVAQLRESLAPEDQMLLTLRIDREMTWLDIATVMSDEELDQAGQRRHSAALRKRFERVKGKLRKLAVREGLIEH